MKVVHVDTGREMRGGQHQVLLLMNALRSAGHESILLGRPHSPLWHAATAEGFNAQPATGLRIWRLSQQAEMVHAHDARAHTLTALACRTTFVVSRRVSFPVRQSIVSRWKYARATRYLAVSRFVAAELAGAGIPTEKIDVVYDAVPARAMADWDPGCPAIALASRDPQKGRDLVERAAAIAGVPVNYSEDLARDLQRASMFIYATRSEGLGSAALLAMNAGVPVIASRVGGLAEVFEDGISGMYVSNDPQEIAAAMRRVRADHEFALRLIQGARCEVQKRFTVEHLVRNTLASYRSALG